MSADMLLQPLLAQAVATLDSFEPLHTILMIIKQLLALIGALVILTGSLYAVCQYLMKVFSSRHQRILNFDTIRLDLGRSIILGLEFIIAADVIETTTTPDYYALGILGLLVVIRTFLNYFLNKDLNALSEREALIDQSHQDRLDV
ncbi:DUF1622 domain-containing protein [Candidatus Protochlamydia phocaeensis]|uniref:DUF1622 domain-containing protein n=1 Tax=Candidatus Protochlamydia phocaeensis TaxID=1414722 RepID=UPI000838562D|nr:DUF1622 domain-containing protein [Candidatus Protochlamydia phocaeensis]